MEFTRKHPGSLATQLLRKLQDAIGKEGVRAAWEKDDRPASTMSYYHRILSANKRTPIGPLQPGGGHASSWNQTAPDWNMVESGDAVVDELDQMFGGVESEANVLVQLQAMCATTFRKGIRVS